MKSKTALLGLLALGVTAGPILAQTTEIYITGATAFRQATMRGIYEAYLDEGALGTTFNAVHDFPGNTLGQLQASNKAIFSGKFPGITGTTIIRTSFNGSTEGLNAIAGNNNPPFLTSNAALTSNGILGNVTGPTTTSVRPRFSFSDVYQETSPITNEVLQPVGASAVGVVTFCMIANDGAPAQFQNTTQQTNRALWQTGLQPLSLFTGNASDTIKVFATGRNDGSGTRSAYLTEWQYGVANPVDQYVQTWNGLNATTPSGVGNGTILRLTRVPADGWGYGPATIAASYGPGNNTIQVNAPVQNLGTGSTRLITGPGIPANTHITATSGSGPITLTLNQTTTGSGTAGGTVQIRGTGNFATNTPTNASVLWGNTGVGNGGYSSGSALRTLMGYTSANVTIYDGENQTPLLTGQNIILLTWLSSSDSKDAAVQGAKILSYNGVKVTPLELTDPANYLGSGFNETDFNKIVNGQYSAWSYQHLYYHGSISGGELAWYNEMVGPGKYIEEGLQATANGVRLSDMAVERAGDGLPITSL